MNNISDLSYCFFFNGDRGLNILKLFNKKNLKVNKIFISIKFLRPQILKKIPKKNQYKLISNLNQKIISKTLKNTDIALSCGFPLIFNQSILKLPRFGFLNCHAGKLPKYRGGSPLNWQLINCEKNFGISVIKMNDKIDAGDVFSEKNFHIKKNYDINSLHKIANKNFPQMVIKSIAKILNKKKPKKMRKKSLIWKQRTEYDSLFEFKNKTFQQADRFVRALQYPYPNAFFNFKDKKYKILKIKRIKKKLTPGEILFESNNLYLGLKNSTVKAEFRNISQ